MGRKKTNKIGEVAKEQIKAFSMDTIEAYSEITNNEKKSKTILIVGGIVICGMLIGWWLLSDTAKDKRIEEQAATDTWGAVEDDVSADDDGMNISEFSNHDKKLVGMWGPEGFSIEEYKDASYDAYMFQSNGHVQKTMAENGESIGEYGEWKSDNQGNVYISWKTNEGKEFYHEVMTYEVNSSDEDGTVLTLEDNDYYPIQDSVIFS